MNLTSHKTPNRLWLIDRHSSTITRDDTKPHQLPYTTSACWDSSWYLVLIFHNTGIYRHLIHWNFYILYFIIFLTHQPIS